MNSEPLESDAVRCIACLVGQLKEGLQDFQRALAKDALAVRLYEIAMVHLGPSREVMTFTTWAP